MSSNAHGLRIGVYVGEGASHSWTWFVDLLEKYAYRRLSFLDEGRFCREAPLLDVLLLSGGDTFAVARALGPAGAEALRAFVEAGGLYIGSCAGAYLPLISSKAPLCDFNFVRSKINNLARDLPPVRALPSKFATSYGCSYIIHPVREEVLVRMSPGFPVWGDREIRVPLYGGPPLQPSDDVEPVAHYTGFTSRTLFLTDPEIAARVYLGKMAACQKRLGKGRLVLLGPHFEHPGFPEGNEIVRCWLESQTVRRSDPQACRQEIESRPPVPRERGGRDCRNGPSRVPTGIGPEGLQRQSGASRLEAWDCAAGSRPLFSRNGLQALKKEVSNMRIRANALARESVSWRIGQKVYEPEKAAYFVDTIWKRLRRLRPTAEESSCLNAGLVSGGASHRADGELRSQADKRAESRADAQVGSRPDRRADKPTGRGTNAGRGGCEDAGSGRNCGAVAEAALLARAAGCHAQVRSLAERIEAGEDSQSAAEAMFKSLRTLTAQFLEMYFGASVSGQ